MKVSNKNQKSQKQRTTTCLIVRLCKSDAASTTGIQGLNEEKKMLLRNKSQTGGTSLQEAIEYVDHDILTNRFLVTHCGGCAILFNKDTFYPNIEVKSLYLHDTRRDLPDQVMEGDRGWVLQRVLSRASFRRPPLSGQKTCTVLVAGDFNGTAWRCRSRNNLSTIDEAFTDCALLALPGRTPLWGPGSIPDNWADVCGFLKPPGSQRSWQVNKHGA